MEIRVAYQPIGIEDTFGFMGAGTVAVAEDTVRVTGRRPYPWLARYGPYLFMAGLFLIFLPLLYYAEISRVIGHPGYWIVIGWIPAILVLGIRLAQGRMYTMVFPRATVQRVERHQEALMLVCTHDGEEASLVMYAYPASAVRDLATALETGGSTTNRVRFGYDIPMNTLTANEKGTLTLTDRQVIFSSLHNKNERLTGLSLAGFLLYNILFALREFLPSTAFIYELVPLLLAALVIGLLAQIQRRPHPYTFSYQHVTEIAVQGNLLRLQFRDASDRPRDILIRPEDPVQAPMLREELQGVIRSLTKN